MYRKRHNRRKPMSQSQGSKRRGDSPQDSRLPKYILFPCSETRRQEKGGFYDREKQRQEASHLDIGTFYDACPAAGWGIFAEEGAGGEGSQQTNSVPATEQPDGSSNGSGTANNEGNKLASTSEEGGQTNDPAPPLRDTWYFYSWRG